MSKIFENRTVIISGGIGDIGFATAIEFALQGANVALGGISQESEALEFVNQIRNYGVQCTYKQLDVANASEVQAWVNDVENTIGLPSLIIANAAIVTLAGIHEITPEQWSRELRVNLDGAFYLTQSATARLLEKKQAGRVVFVGSWAGSTVHPHIPAYSVSKAGMTMLCKCLALELAPHYILVNEVAPGYVSAGLSGRIWKENPGQYEQALEKVPVKKVMTAKSVADQIIYLCHPQNDHITGMTLLIDGGLSLLS